MSEVPAGHLSKWAVPRPLVDPATLPPAIRTSDPDSFAQFTFRERVPGILRDTVRLNDLSGDSRDAMNALIDEVATGSIRPLSEPTPDQAFWNGTSAAHVGRSWLDVPWYWAEAYLYRRILEATGYFRSGAGSGIDPFAVQKATELAADAAPRAAADLLNRLPADPPTRFRTLLYASLWGNRIDLSYTASTLIGRAAGIGESTQNVIVDETERVWATLQGKQVRTAAILADNAGTELMMDLLLIHALLEHGLVDRIELHVKPQPFFVSDATPADVELGLQALEAGQGAPAAVATALRGWRAGGRVRVCTHWHYTSSLFYFELPDDLRQMLSAVDLVILKGDANYRRLLGDAHWPPTTSFESATQYFPAPLVALRTLKAEIVIGLAPGQAEQLSADDSSWRVNGKRGLIQTRL